MEHPLRYSATWVALAQSVETLNDLIPITNQTGNKALRGWRELSVKETDEPWTDDYSNVLSALK